MKATIKIKALTNRFNGYEMPIVEATSDVYFEAPNMGMNEFMPNCEIDESDLLRLRTMFNTITTTCVMLEIEMPNKPTPKSVWYKLSDVYVGGRGSNLIF
jgi:hypothetical protein